MIQERPLGAFRCKECEEVVVVYGDDRLTPDPDDYTCVYCLDPRQREHDEFREAEREALGGQPAHAIDCDMDEDCVCR